MNIEKIELNYWYKGSLSSTTADGVTHHKILPWLSIVQATEGSYLFSAGDRELRTTGEGGFFVAPAGEQQTIVHKTNPKTGWMYARWLFLDVSLNGGKRPENFFDFPSILPKTVSKEMNRLFDELFAVEDPFDEAICSYRILKLLFSAATPKKETIPPSMQEVLHYIEENLSSKITVEVLSRQAHLSPSHFFTVFKKQFGLPPLTFVNRLRLSMAAEYLLKTDESVARIGNRVGIEDALYFSKCFRHAYGMSPSSYRKKYVTQEERN
ncbi:MAG: helix-turn-helix transcriptional regulator [Clostridia bacterium]|nr:helix-turn-helix transcriptional regulator [Clostridia bacterium]